MRLIRRALAIGLTATGASFALVPAGSSAAPASVRPHVATTDVPAGWLQVPYGNAQISVPPDWAVVSDGAAQCGPSTGVVIRGSGQWCPQSMNDPTQPNTSIVTFTNLNNDTGAGLHVAMSQTGSAIYGRGIGTRFAVQPLGVGFSISGPAQFQVLHTLTFSPRAVMLASGPTKRTPSTWRRISFAGVQFAAPPSWPVRRIRNASACATDLQLAQLGVTLASSPPLPFSCPLPPAAFKPVAEVPGIELDSFWVGPRARNCEGPQKLSDIRLCVTKTPAYGVAVAEVFVPGHKPMTLKIGLSGGGAVARTILDSIH